MNSKRVALFVDSYWRDAPGIVLLKKELVKLNMVVDIVPFDLWNEYLSLISPDHAVLNHVIGKRNREISRRVKSNGGTISVMPTEGRPNTDIQNKWYAQQDGNCDYFFHWSSLTQKLFKKTKSDIYGNPRFEAMKNLDLVATPNETLEKHSIPYNGRLNILFATSFPQAKFHTQAVNFNSGDWKDLDVPMDALEEAKNEHDYREQSVTLLRWLSSLDRFNIMIRPHPMEDSVFWDRLQLKNTTIVTQEFSHNLILASDIVMNRVGCTTTLEAALLERRVWSVKYNDHLPGAVQEIEDTTESKGDILQTMIAIFNGDSIKIPNKSLAKKYGLLKRNPSQKIAKKIDELTTKNENNIPFTSMIEWNKVLLEHTDKYVYPKPGFHPGKSPVKYDMDTLYMKLS